MKASEILKLIDAGYTKAEIQAMEEPETGAAPDPAPAPAPAAVPEKEQKQEEQKQEENKSIPEAPAAGNPQIDALTKQIGSLISVIQKSNMMTSQQPAPPAQSAEDVLASIIRPTHKRAEQNT